MEQCWRILAALTFARASMGFQFQSVASVAPFLTGDLGIDNAQLGWLIGLYPLPGVVVALPGGLLGAYFGDKRVARIGLGMMVGGGIWLALAGDFAEANRGRFVSGVGAVIINVPFVKMAADWFEGKERLLAMSFLVNSWPIGIGLALLVLGMFGETAGWRWSLGLVAMFAACGFSTVLGMYRPPGTGDRGEAVWTGSCNADGAGVEAPGDRIDTSASLQRGLSNSGVVPTRLLHRD